MKIEIWSDVVCPFCALGKKNLEAALAQFEHRDTVQIEWKSFELDPSAPRGSKQSIAEVLAQKYGRSVEWARKMNAEMAARAAAQGATFNFEKVIPSNSFDAHRLIHFAKAAGKQSEAQAALFDAYFKDGKDIGDAATLLTIARELGLDADGAAEMLASDAYKDVVRADESEAQELGITGVPFFLINGELGVSGAHPAEAFLEALERVHAGSEATPHSD